MKKNFLCAFTMVLVAVGTSSVFATVSQSSTVRLNMSSANVFFKVNKW